MSKQPVNNSNFVFTQKDMEYPLGWVEGLSEEQLLNWLRKALWTRNALPLVIASNSRVAVEVAGLLKAGSRELKSRVRLVVPILLREWGRDDAGDLLDDLLIICGRLKCAASEPDIALLMTERLRNRPEAVELRQRCLSVLSGFGCTERTLLKFEEYVKDIEYAATCYRALYRYDLKYAATELQNIVAMFQQAGALDELDIISIKLANDLESPNEIMWLLARYLEHADRPELIIHVLEVLRGVKLLTAAPFVAVSSERRVEVFRLLLERCPPEDLQDLLLLLDSVGLGLYSMKSADGREYIQGVAYDLVTDRRDADTVIETRFLPEPAVDALVAGSESVAKSWADAPERDWTN